MYNICLGKISLKTLNIQELWKWNKNFYVYVKEFSWINRYTILKTCPQIPGITIMSRPLYCNTFSQLYIPLIKYLQIEFNPQRVNPNETFIIKINVRRLQGIYDNSFVMVSVFLTHFFSQRLFFHKIPIHVGSLECYPLFLHSFIAFYLIWHNLTDSVPFLSFSYLALKFSAYQNVVGHNSLWYYICTSFLRR